MRITKKICDELKAKGFTVKSLKDLCPLCMVKDKLNCSNRERRVGLTNKKGVKITITKKEDTNV